MDHGAGADSYTVAGGAAHQERRYARCWNLQTLGFQAKNGRRTVGSSGNTSSGNSTEDAATTTKRRWEMERLRGARRRVESGGGQRSTWLARLSERRTAAPPLTFPKYLPSLL